MRRYMSLYISSFMKLKYLTRPYEFSVYQIHQRYVRSSSWHGGLREVVGFGTILEEDFMPLTRCQTASELGTPRSPLLVKCPPKR